MRRETVCLIPGFQNFCRLHSLIFMTALLASCAATTTIQPSYKFDQFPGHGVVIGIYALETKGFSFKDLQASDATKLVNLVARPSGKIYRFELAEPGGEEWPFYISLPAGKYEFIKSNQALSAKVNIFSITPEPVSLTETKAVEFVVAPGQVNCIGRVAVMLRLIMIDPFTSALRFKGDFAVNDNCDPIIAKFQQKYGELGGRARKAMAKVRSGSTWER
jgi:hypothetical protein